MYRPRRTAPAAVALLAFLAVAGCSDDESGPSGTGSPTEAASGSSEEPAAPGSSSGTPEPTGSAAEPGVEPASGPLLEGDGATLRAPEGWKVADQEVSWVTLASSPDSRQSVTISSVPSADRSTLDSLEDSALATAIVPERTKAQPRRDIAGVEAFHLVGPSISGGRLDQFGALNAEQQVLLEFGTPSSMPRARRDALIDSVLASIEWK